MATPQTNGSRFKRATKDDTKLRLAIGGPAGSGKTYTALKLATHLGKEPSIAVIDSEHGRAQLYADKFTFDHLELTSFSLEEYISAITEAEGAGYSVVIIDSLSHAWQGRDGALEEVERVATRMKTANKFAGWSTVTPKQNALIDKITASPAHIIATMRTKMAYSQDKTDSGRTVIRKLGLQPIQREGIDYEFDVYGEMDLEHSLAIAKTRFEGLVDRVFPKPGTEVAEIILDELRGTVVTIDMVREQLAAAKTVHEYYSFNSLVTRLNDDEKRELEPEWREGLKRLQDNGAPPQEAPS
jgi:KaiC/GvpD/RAD55 family RecA-like ATPase